LRWPAVFGRAQEGRNPLRQRQERLSRRAGNHLRAKPAREGAFGGRSSRSGGRGEGRLPLRSRLQGAAQRGGPQGARRALSKGFLRAPLPPEDQGAADLGGGAAANLVPEGEADRGGLRASAIGARGRVRGAAPRRGGDPFGCRWLGLALSSARGNQPRAIHPNSTRPPPPRSPHVRLPDV